MHRTELNSISVPASEPIEKHFGDLQPTVDKTMQMFLIMVRTNLEPFHITPIIILRQFAIGSKQLEPYKAGREGILGFDLVSLSGGHMKWKIQSPK